MRSKASCIANNHISEAWADAMGRLLKSQGATGPAVSYTYDPADRLTSALYGNAQTQISYDLAGRKLSLDDPDMGLWTYAYDALGNLTRQTDARGQRICLYYDPLNRLTGKHYRADDACPTSPSYNVSYGYKWCVQMRTRLTNY